jgi:cyclic 2,3-diphosphoglycerate synthetase
VRILALVDGEHHPPVVRAALAALPARFDGAEVVAALLVGGTEKLSPDRVPDYGPGIPVVGVVGEPARALASVIVQYRADLVVDLSDQPVLDARSRMQLAAHALFAGVPYAGADFRFDPPPRPRVATKPTVAVIATGKRAGKTAVTGELARLLRDRGTPPVVVTMGRGGPAEPELIDPATTDLSPAALVALAATGRHAASDHFEDAVTTGVVTIGTRRCGGGLAGAPGDATFVAGVELANTRPERVMLLEGSGAAVPPVHADATICLIPDTEDPELVTGYLGGYRVLLSDLVVITMVGASSAVSGDRALTAGLLLEEGVRGVAPGVKVAHVVLRPFPLEPISGRRVLYVTTAPASARADLVEHLEGAHGGRIVGVSHHLADRQRLAADLQEAGEAEILLVELKAAAVDLAASVAVARGMRVVFCDNRVHSVSGETAFSEVALATADLAVERHT